MDESFQKDQSAFQKNLTILRSLGADEHKAVLKIYDTYRLKNPMPMDRVEAIAWALRDRGHPAIIPTHMDEGALEYEEILAEQDAYNALEG